MSHAHTMSTSPDGDLDVLIRDRGELRERIQRGDRLAPLVRAFLAVIVVGAGLFGAAIGSYRGGVQIAFAAIKLPMLFLGTAVVCAPVLTALSAALERPTSLRRDVALLLAAIALASAILVAEAPLILFAVTFELSYHKLALLLALCSASAGLGAIAFLASALRSGSERSSRGGTAILVGATVLVFAIVGAQMSWTTRPYLVRPRSPDVPFVRAVEGSLLESLATSLDSARGHYERDRAPLPGGGGAP